MDNKYIYFETYGCSANQNNTEIMKGLVSQAGLQLTNNPEIADLIVINTCIVKGPTEKKIERRIEELAKLKKIIILAGCMPEVRRDFKNIYYLGTRHVKDIVRLIRKIYDSNYEEKEFIGKNNEIKLMTAKISQNKKIGITQISEGCLGECSYCITRIAKGKLFSYPEKEIIKNIKRDIEAGCKEIWLTSQDNASYGLENGDRKLIELLKKIASIEGKFKIRLGMMNPNNILPVLDELIEIYKNEKMYKFLHIPVQSGSNKILKLMKRKYEVKDFLKIINKFRENITEITISTDIIVGFPSETYEEFQETTELIKKIEPDMLNLSKYWPMKGTQAEKMEQVPESESKIRADFLVKMFKDIVKGKKGKMVGIKEKVLVSDRNKDYFLARDDSYRLIKIKNGENILGKFVNVKITRIENKNLIGEIE